MILFVAGLIRVWLLAVTVSGAWVMLAVVLAVVFCSV